MPYTQSGAVLGSVSSVTSTPFVVIPRGVYNSKAGPIVSVTAASVTSGAVLAIDVKGAGKDAREVHRFTVTADGTTIIPLHDLPEAYFHPEQVSLRVVSRTDGAYLGLVLTAA